ncbi:hypothetical protein V490_04547, partial [Pseudogymnoascus sp. VKM F-3557]
MDHNPEGYLQDFHQFFCILDHPLAVSPPPLLDIDLCIVSEKHAELLLQKTVCWRVNAVLQMLFTSHSADDEANVHTLPDVSHRPIYSPGLRFGSFMIPDLWCHSFMDIMQKDRPFVVGDVKLARKWNSSVGRSGNNDYEIRYRTTLAQTLHPTAVISLYHPNDNIKVLYNAGTVRGFASSFYILPDHKTFIIALSNATGLVDVSDHISRLILQELSIHRSLESQDEYPSAEVDAVAIAECGADKMRQEMSATVQ